MGFVSILFIIAGIVTLYFLSKSPASSRQKQEQNRLFLRRFFYFLLLCFLCFTLYAANFSVVDNIYYYNCSVLFLVIFLPLGIVGFFKRFPVKINHKNIAILILLLLIPLLVVNYPAVNKKNNYFAADFIHNLFSTMEPNAILFASDVHILIHPIYYFQSVEKLRNDIIILPQHGLRRGWFVEQPKTKFPGIYRELSSPHKDADAIRHAYMFMLKERGILEATRGNFDLALKWIEQAVAVFPAKKLLSNTENGRRILPNRLKDVLKAKQWVMNRKKGTMK